ncbi:electron transport complex protein RnfG [Rhodoferax antarcticus ANT.BR]|uniref:Electron transport complex protein RnfG n=2 Tax=Rhodoferax antarcticus TaxID=81479 RepID=A0A1Q8YIR0_9BURK|nr:electron transport complex protein RnfG [Rhodoferax antarcticus ANT.BR]
MLVALGLVAAICGLIIVVAYEASLGSVKENRRVAMERAIHKVLPGAALTVAYLALPNGSITLAGSEEAPDDAMPFHAAFDAAGQLMGIAAEGMAKGYAGNVRIMFGYSPGCDCVVGFGVVSMQETPGIGDKILKDANFLANFKALDVRLAKDMKTLANEVKTVKHGTKTQAWQIDAISGATVTSRAVGRAINDAAQALLPVLVPQIDKIGPSK